MDLASYPAQRCADLSFAGRRRVEFAQAIVRSPRLLLLDEPASGLSPRERDHLKDLIGRIAASLCTIVIVEHDLDFLTGLATRLVCLSRGRVIADGPFADVIADAAVTEAYLGPSRPAPISWSPSG